MNAPSLDVPMHPVAPSTEAATLEPAIRAARDLAHELDAVPANAPEAQHPNFGVARALALTLVDMLGEIGRDARGDGGRRRNGGRAR